MKPKIVCLCGSTRFSDAFEKANLTETLAGKIVLTVGCMTHSDEQLKAVITSEKKIELDELHKRKIDLADEVLILNVGGYIGQSTLSELEYAIKHMKIVRFLEEPTDRSTVHRSCNNCLNKCMDMDMDPYCSVVNKPWGRVLRLGHPIECGDGFALWQLDTRNRKQKRKGG